SCGQNAWANPTSPSVQALPSANAVNRCTHSPIIKSYAITRSPIERPLRRKRGCPKRKQEQTYRLDRTKKTPPPGDPMTEKRPTCNKILYQGGAVTSAPPCYRSYADEIRVSMSLYL